MTVPTRLPFQGPPTVPVWPTPSPARVFLTRVKSSEARRHPSVDRGLARRFVGGGDGNRRLTPSFRLKEFRKPDGSVRVHRELVSALQLLRDRFGKSLSLKGTNADGLTAIVAGEPAAELLAAAEALRDRRVFESASRDDGGVRVHPRSRQLAAD